MIRKTILAAALVTAVSITSCNTKPGKGATPPKGGVPSEAKLADFNSSPADRPQGK